MSTGTTSNGYPFPNGDDPVRNGDNVMRALAEAIGVRLETRRAGPVNVTTTTGGGGTVRFSTPYDVNNVPVLTLWCVNQPTYVLALNDVGAYNALDNLGFAFRCHRHDGTLVTSETIVIRYSALGVVRPT